MAQIGKFLPNQLQVALGKDASKQICDNLQGTAGEDADSDFGIQSQAICRAFMTIINARTGFTPKITANELKTEIRNAYRALS